MLGAYHDTGHPSRGGVQRLLRHTVEPGRTGAGRPPGQWELQAIVLTKVGRLVSEAGGRNRLKGGTRSRVAGAGRATSALGRVRPSKGQVQLVCCGASTARRDVAHDRLESPLSRPPTARREIWRPAGDSGPSARAAGSINSPMSPGGTAYVRAAAAASGSGRARHATTSWPSSASCDRRGAWPRC